MNKQNRLQWIALLSLAIVLPTVSLLWFMSRVVANERLVVQQKLATLYQDKLTEAGEQAWLRISARFDVYSETDWTMNPYGLLTALVLEDGFQGMVFWDADGTQIYPSVGDPSSLDAPSADRYIAEAWQKEFVEQDYAEAAGLYEVLAAAAEQPHLAQIALAGQVRCLSRLERWEEAIEAAASRRDPQTASVQLLLLSLLERAGPEEERHDPAAARQDRMARVSQVLADSLFNSSGKERLPTAQNLFLARRLQGYIQHIEFHDNNAFSERLGRLIAAEELSMAAQQSFMRPAGLIDTFARVRIAGERRYAVRRPMPYGDIMIIMTDEGLASALDGYRAELADTEAQFRVFDADEQLIAGDAGEGIAAIAAAPLPHGFPDGRVELFFADGDIFNKTAGRQIAAYIWTAVLVILMMLVVGTFAFFAVGRQIRLNRMKNDFIATVSHELKTPLASMRVLVDTLLEGRVRNEEHAEEYLRLVSRENERLTRMIENFLSFSRMERNRNAFELEPASPSAIVADAVESVSTKFNACGCRLETEVGENLPESPVDHDAIVTVLINLLDNACKYSEEDKRVMLTVATDQRDLCFSVSDHGVGLSSRQIKKIFDSFYRVDNSLARTTEGCGLGLSIVQFIVKAHKGSIEVDSQPGMGSTFTVRLPINPKNGA
jgi:signal transduction histidine kinase